MAKKPVPLSTMDKLRDAAYTIGDSTPAKWIVSPSACSQLYNLAETYVLDYSATLWQTMLTGEFKLTQLAALFGFIIYVDESLGENIAELRADDGSVSYTVELTP